MGSALWRDHMGSALWRDHLGSAMWRDHMGSALWRDHMGSALWRDHLGSAFLLSPNRKQMSDSCIEMFHLNARITSGPTLHRA